MPKRGRGGRTALKDLGKPEGSEETVQVYDGPYGLYVKQGKVNASLPEGKAQKTSPLKKPSNCWQRRRQPQRQAVNQRRRSLRRRSRSEKTSSEKGSCYNENGSASG